MRSEFAQWLDDMQHIAKEIYPDNMGGMEQKGVYRYRAGYVKGYKDAINVSNTPPPISQPAGNDAVRVEEIMSDLWDKYSSGGMITKAWFDRIIYDFIKATNP